MHRTCTTSTELARWLAIYTPQWSKSWTECGFEALTKEYYAVLMKIIPQIQTSQTASSGSVCWGKQSIPGWQQWRERDNKLAIDLSHHLQWWVCYHTTSWNTTDPCATVITPVMDCSVKNDLPSSRDHYESIFVCTFFWIFKAHQTSTTALMADLKHA